MALAWSVFALNLAWLGFMNGTAYTVRVRGFAAALRPVKKLQLVQA
jgi:hypothetical protein